MQHLNSADKLKTAIIELESKRAQEERMLKEEFLHTYESLKPINLLKSTVNEVATSPDLQDKMINAAIGLTTGYLTNLLFQRFSDSPFKKLVGTAIQFGITHVIVKNPEVVKAIGLGLYHMIRSRSERKHKRNQDSATE